MVFTKIYNNDNDEDEKAIKMPKLNKGDEISYKTIDGKQHFTQPPAKFSEASLVKTLKKMASERPSTYAPIISTLFR